MKRTFQIYRYDPDKTRQALQQKTQATLTKQKLANYRLMFMNQTPSSPSSPP
jgi:hypothetical protein